MTLSIQAYEPDVQCSDPSGRAAAVRDCQVVLDGMPTGTVPLSFGTRGIYSVDVQLPLALGQCESPLPILELSGVALCYYTADEQESGSHVCD